MRADVREGESLFSRVALTTPAARTKLGTMVLSSSTAQRPRAAFAVAMRDVGACCAWIALGAIKQGES